MTKNSIFTPEESSAEQVQAANKIKRSYRKYAAHKKFLRGQGSVRAVSLEQYEKAPQWFKDMVDVPNLPAGIHLSESTEWDEIVETAWALHQGRYEYLFQEPFVDRRDVIATAARLGLITPEEMMDSYRLLMYRQDFGATPVKHSLDGEDKSLLTSKEIESVLSSYLRASPLLLTAYYSMLGKTRDRYFFTIEINPRIIALRLKASLERCFNNSLNSLLGKDFIDSSLYQDIDAILEDPVFRHIGFPCLALLQKFLNIEIENESKIDKNFLDKVSLLYKDIVRQLNVTVRPEESLHYAFFKIQHSLFKPQLLPTNPKKVVLVILPTELLRAYVGLGIKRPEIRFFPVLGLTSEEKVVWARKKGGHVIQLAKPWLRSQEGDWQQTDENNLKEADGYSSGAAIIMAHDELNHVPLLARIPEAHYQVFLALHDFFAAIDDHYLKQHAWDFADMNFAYQGSGAYSKRGDDNKDISLQNFVIALKQVFDRPPGSNAFFVMEWHMLLSLLWLRLNWNKFSLNFSWQSLAAACVPDYDFSLFSRHPFFIAIQKLPKDFIGFLFVGLVDPVYTRSEEKNNVLHDLLCKASPNDKTVNYFLTQDHEAKLLLAKNSAGKFPIDLLLDRIAAGYNASSSIEAYVYYAIATAIQSYIHAYANQSSDKFIKSADRLIERIYCQQPELTRRYMKEALAGEIKPYKELTAEKQQFVLTSLANCNLKLFSIALPVEAMTEGVLSLGRKHKVAGQGLECELRRGFLMDY